MKLLLAVLVAMMLALSQAVTITDLDSGEVVSEPELPPTTEDAPTETLESNEAVEETESEELILGDLVMAELLAQEVEMALAREIILEEIVMDALMVQEAVALAQQVFAEIMTNLENDVPEKTDTVSEPIIEEIVDEPESAVTESTSQTVEATA